MIHDINHSATIFAALADPVCLRIIEELSRQPRYVSELACLVNASQSWTSKLLKRLCSAGIVVCEIRPHTEARQGLPNNRKCAGSVQHWYALKGETLGDVANELRVLAPTGRRSARQGIV